jgi:hypothetical protein
MSRRGLPWWLAPFVGSVVAMVGAFVVVLIMCLPLGRALGESIGKGFGRMVSRLWIPLDRTPDLVVLPGAEGYVSPRLAGRQLHFHDKEGDVTLIAVDLWLSGGKVRLPVAEYGGPPTSTLGVGRVRRVLDLPFPLLVVRTDAAEVWWSGGGAETPRGPNRPEGGEANLLVFPGKLSLWAGEGPRYELAVEGNETVWCTLGPEGLGIERRERR